ALREALAQRNGDGSRKAISSSVYPMNPIGVVQSCFSTRNGTPRQPLLVPLARACLVLDPTRVPVEGLEGLADYSHCWILYVFHLNTDLDKLWKEPSRSKFKAKVRVPRLEGGKMGVLATRSPHRPCPIGLTVAKPVLDIKPYLPYSDSVEGATVPNWVKGDNKLAVRSVSFSPEFASSLSSCWVHTQKQSLYASADEFRSFIEEVLAWDIRSLSQRSRPHSVDMRSEDHGSYGDLEEDDQDERLCDLSRDSHADVIYHLLLEGIDVSYRIDEKCNVVVEKATLVCNVGDRSSRGYFMWRDKLEQKK
ncbi:Nef-associated protein 1, partial [Ananas comosus]